MLLRGKTAVISGAASPRGIGLATARRFAAEGARVAILDIDGAAAETAARSLDQGPGEPHLGIACNVADQASCAKAIETVIGAFGRIDILINNAGVTQPVKFLEITPSDWDRIQDVNLKGILFLSQAVIPHMRKRKSGSIACMSSVSAQRGGGIFGGPHYSAAKAGVLGLAKAMAREFGPDGIRVIGTVGPAQQNGVRELGATPIDYRNSDVPARVRELAPDGVAAVFARVSSQRSEIQRAALVVPLVSARPL